MVRGVTAQRVRDKTQLEPDRSMGKPKVAIPEWSRGGGGRERDQDRSTVLSETTQQCLISRREPDPYPAPKSSRGGIDQDSSHHQRGQRYDMREGGEVMLRGGCHRRGQLYGGG